MEWIAYYEIEPWGEALHGFRSATNTAAIYNAGMLIASPKELKKRQFKPEDFLVGVQQKKKTETKQTWEQQKAILETVFGKAKKADNASR